MASSSSPAQASAPAQPAQPSVNAWLAKLEAMGGDPGLGPYGDLTKALGAPGSKEYRNATRGDVKFDETMLQYGREDKAQFMPTTTTLYDSKDISGDQYYQVGIRGEEKSTISILDAPYFNTGVTHYGERQLEKKRAEVLLQAEQIANNLKREEVVSKYGTCMKVRARGDYALADELEKSVANQVRAIQEIQGQVITVANKLIDKDIERAKLDSDIRMCKAYLNSVGTVPTGSKDHTEFMKNTINDEFKAYFKDTFKDDIGAINSIRAGNINPDTLWG